MKYKIAIEGYIGSFCVHILLLENLRMPQMYLRMVKIKIKKDFRRSLTLVSHTPHL